MSPAREDLVVRHVDYAGAVATKVSKGLPISVEDAVSAGYLGLVKAAQRFDLDRPEEGDIDRNFRSFAFLHIRGAVLDESRNNTFVKRRGLERGVKFDMVPLAVSPDLLGSYDVDESTEELLSALGEQERLVVVGKLAGYTGKEIASIMGLTPIRVSQILAETRKKLLANA